MYLFTIYLFRRDGLVDLVEQGIVTNSRKVKHAGKVISTFCMGSKRSYQFLDDNAHINLLDAGYVNDVSVIRQNPRVVAINSAIEVLKRSSFIYSPTFFDLSKGVVIVRKLHTVPSWYDVAL